MAEVTVWACKKCGRSGDSVEICRSCSGTMGQIVEADAIRRFMEYWEPPTGWYSDEVMRKDWRDNRVHVEQPPAALRPGEQRRRDRDAVRR